MGTRLELDYIHVVIGIIRNTKDEVLIARRQENAHLGGLLEFPGGKVGSNETSVQALTRELKEELNINLLSCSKLIQFPYSYSDRKLFLEVYLVDQYSGEARANESQEIQWQDISSLNTEVFPSANYGIIRALQLPKLVAITPEYNQDPDNFLVNFEKTLKRDDVSIIHLRSHELSDTQYMQLAEECLLLCNKNDTKLILNRDPSVIETLNVSGVHLTSKWLLETKVRPLGKECLVSASCHDLNELMHAIKINLDYVFLGPVIEKYQSKNSEPLGWQKFASMTQASVLPTYAIGGLTTKDVETSIECGGQGIAAIRDLWVV